MSVTLRATQIVSRRTLGQVVAGIKAPCTLFIDCEGRDLGRNGTLDLMALYQRRDLPYKSLTVKRPAKHLEEPSALNAAKHIYVINLHRMGNEAWQPVCTSGTGRSLQNILESPEYTKVLWALNSDVEALYALKGVRLGGPIVDLQLMEQATLGGVPGRLMGLEAAVTRDARLPPAHLEAWREVKAEGTRLYDFRKGGSFDVFQEGKLRNEILQYVANDVRFLPALYDQYRKAMTDEQYATVVAMSQEAAARAVLCAGRPKADVEHMERMRLLRAKVRQRVLLKEVRGLRKKEKEKRKEDEKEEGRKKEEEEDFMDSML